MIGVQVPGTRVEHQSFEELSSPLSYSISAATFLDHIGRNIFFVDFGLAGSEVNSGHRGAAIAVPATWS